MPLETAFIQMREAILKNHKLQDRLNQLGEELLLLVITERFQYLRGTSYEQDARDLLSAYGWMQLA